MINRTLFILQNAFNGLKEVSPTPTLAADFAEGASKSGSSWDSFMQLVGLVVLLIVILAAAYYTTKFVGGIKLGQMKNSNFKLIDAYRISPNKVIQIVKIANKYIVLAVAKDTINFITELDEADVYIRDENTKELQSFKQTLEKIRNINK